MRVLFLNNDVLGWRTFARTLEHYSADRDDLDCVHLRLQTKPWLRALTVGIEGTSGLDPHILRVRAWRRMVARWLRTAVPLEHFDVVHVAPQFPALAVAEMRGSWPGILSVSFDSTVIKGKAMRVHGDEAAARERFQRLVEAEQLIVSRSQLLCPMSEWAANSLHVEYGVPRSKMILLPPVLAGTMPLVPAEHADAGPIRLCFVGNDWERKGGPDVLRWHQERWSDRAELHVFSSGAKKVEGGKNVVLHGSVTHDELVLSWLPKMDVFVFPTHADQSPWAVVEAASVGLPVVASDIGGLSDIVKDGETGYLVAPDDEAAFTARVEQLLDDGGLRRQMGERARRHATQAFDGGRLFNAFFDRLVAEAG